jgi:hypothetical protein
MNAKISKNRKLATTLVMALALALSVSLMTSPTVSVFAAHDNGNQKSKDKPKVPKCNNVQILVKVSKIPEGSKIVTSQTTLNGKTIEKVKNVQGDNKIAIPFQFKKLNPCPTVGDSFSGNVNGTSFGGTIASLKKVNKVNVALS